MRKYILAIFQDLTKYDKLPRALELADLVFSVITSATSFAQLKRHRMMTLLPGKYDPNLGYTIPPSIADIGLESKLIEEINRHSKLFYDLQNYNEHLAVYSLTNAHRRTNVVKMNLRELYAISRLREDEHAQWDIRKIANQMTTLAKKAYPNFSIFLGGKHEFDDIKRRVYENG